METSDAPESDPPTSAVRELPLRLGLALLVMLAQILATIAALALVWLPAGTDWFGLAHAIIGVLIAIAAGAAIGSLVAAKLRLPLYLLYCLPAPLLAATQWLDFNSTIIPWEPVGLTIVAGADLLIALATAGRPRRPARPKRDGAPLPSV